MEKLIEIENLSAGYEGAVVLEKINLNIYKNDFLGIIGPNGGGKTTLLKVILGLLKPYSGKIQKDEEVENKIGYLPQFSLIDKKFPITVYEVVLSGLFANKGIFSGFGKVEKQQVDKILKDFGILDLKNKALYELSGGQLQKTFLGRAIVSTPKLLILDEPDTFVDSDFKAEFYKILNELNKKMAIVLVSHDIGMVSSQVRNIACVNRFLYYHDSPKITEDMLKVYSCPVELIAHGDIPHRVLKKHK